MLNMLRKKTEKNENLPSANGMRVVGIIDKFEFQKYLKGYGTEEYGNDVRSDLDDTPKTIGEFENKIKNGTYKPKVYTGPTMKWTGSYTPEGKKIYKLCTGWHRTTAHDGLGIETMYFIVVEFFDYLGKSASYWESIWKALENKENTELVKNVRKAIDLINKVVNMISEDEVKPNEKPILETLSDMECTDTEKNNLLPKIFDKLGHTQKIVTPITKRELNVICNEVATKHPTWTVEPLTLEKNSADYESRKIIKIMRKTIKDPSYIDNLVVACKYGSGEVTEHKKIRKEKKNIIGDYIDNVILPFAEIINEKKENGGFSNPKILHAYHLPGEVDIYNKTGNLPTK